MAASFNRNLPRDTTPHSICNFGILYRMTNLLTFQKAEKVCDYFQTTKEQTFVLVCCVYNKEELKVQQERLTGDLGYILEKQHVEE